MIGLGEPMLDAVLLAGAPEDVLDPSLPAVLIALDELYAIVGKDGVDLVGHRLDEHMQEGCRGQFGGFAIEPGESSRRGRDVCLQRGWNRLLRLHGGRSRLPARPANGPQPPDGVEPGAEVATDVEDDPIGPDPGAGEQVLAQDELHKLRALGDVRRQCVELVLLEVELRE